jgi:hypothetical protein
MGGLPCFHACRGKKFLKNVFCKKGILLKFYGLDSESFGIFRGRSNDLGGHFLPLRGVAILAG